MGIGGLYLQRDNGVGNARPLFDGHLQQRPYSEVTNVLLCRGLRDCIPTCAWDFHGCRDFPVDALVYIP